MRGGHFKDACEAGRGRSDKGDEVDRSQFKNDLKDALSLVHGSFRSTLEATTPCVHPGKPRQVFAEGLNGLLPLAFPISDAHLTLY